MALRDFIQKTTEKFPGIGNRLSQYGFMQGQPIVYGAGRLLDYLNKGNKQTLNSGGVATPVPQTQTPAVPYNPPAQSYTPPPQTPTFTQPTNPVPAPTPAPNFAQFDPNTNYFQLANQEGLNAEDLSRLQGRIIDQRNNILTGAPKGIGTAADKLGFDPFEIAKRAGIVLPSDSQDRINQAIGDVYSPAISDVTARLGYALDKEMNAAKAGPDLSSLLGNMGSGTQGKVSALLTSSIAGPQAERIKQALSFDSSEENVNRLYKQVGMQLLKGDELNKFNTANETLSQIPNAMNIANLVGANSPYKNIKENYVQYLGGEQSQDYKRFEQAVSLISAPIRLNFFGASLTEGEKSAANAFLPDPKSDTMETILTKLQGIENFYKGVQDRLIDQKFGVQTSSLGNATTQNQQQGQVEYFGGKPFRLDPSTGQYFEVTSFNQVGGGTNQAINSIDNVLQRIARNEGTGKYDQLGPVVASGPYKGERAIGRYQVMPGNVPSWTKEALGYAMTPEQFKQNAQAQEAVARDQMLKSYKKYGNWNDVASVWFTGRPLSQGYASKDVLGTSGAEYVRRFNL